MVSCVADNHSQIVPDSPLIIGLMAGVLYFSAIVPRAIVAYHINRLLSHNPQKICLIDGDAEGYWLLSQTIRRGEDYAIYSPPRRVLRMPGFPTILACLQWLGLSTPTAARYGLVAITSLQVPAIYVLAYALTRHRLTSILVGTIVAWAPLQVAFSPLILSEATFALTIVMALCPWSRLLAHDQNPHYMLAAWAGCAAAWATLVRPTWLLMTLLLCLIKLYICPKWRAFKESVVTLTLLFLGLLPWIVRNYLVTHHLIITTLWSGPSLYDGLNPSATGRSDMTFYDQDNLLVRFTEYEVDRIYRQRAWEYALRHPFHVLQLAMQKQLRFWSLSLNWLPAGLPPHINFIVILWTLITYSLALLGTLGRATDVRVLIICWLPLLYLAFIHAIFVGSVRYRMPAEPLLAIPMAYGLRHLACQLKSWLNHA